MAKTKRNKAILENVLGEKVIPFSQEEIKESKEEKEVSQEIKNFLAPEHLLQIEVGQRDIENSRLLMAVEEQSLKNMTLELEILTQKIEKQKIVLRQRQFAYDNMVKQFRKLKGDLWPVYGLKDEEGMGYNPTTGEIVRS